LDGERPGRFGFSWTSTDARVFKPILKPLALKDVPKVIQAMRQTQSRKVLVKLLTRIKVGLFSGCTVMGFVEFSDL
jgi:hypothetical protein